MADDIIITMTSDDRDLMQSYLRQTDRIQKLQLELRKMAQEARKAGQEHKKAVDDGGTGADVMIGRLTAIGAGWISATAAVSGYMAVNKKAIEESDAAYNSIDSQRRRSQLLMKLRGKEGEDANAKIEQQAIDRGVKPEIGHEIAQQMAGSGFDVAEIVGGALASYLDVLSATGEDPNAGGVGAEGIQALSRYFASQGIEKTAANIDKYGSKVQRLMGPTDLNFGNMTDLSNVSAGFKGMLSPDEQLAMYANMVSGKPGSQAATAMADIVKNFSIAGSKKDAVDWLKKMGMSPEDINLKGENIGEALDRVRTGLGKLSANNQDIALAKIFEGSNIDEVKYLVENRKAIYDLIPEMNDNAGFKGDVALMQGGRALAGQRQEGRGQLLDAARADTGTLLGQELQLQSKESGEAPFLRDRRSWAYSILRYLGASPETAGTASSYTWSGLAELDPLTRVYSGENYGSATSAIQENVSKAQQSVNTQISGPQADALIKALDANTKATLEATKPQPRSVPAPAPRPTAQAGRP